MKKLTLFIISATLLVSCSKSLTDRAKTSVAEYLKSNMNDFNSYEAVDWGNLDTTYSTYSESAEGIMLKDSADFYYSVSQKLLDECKTEPDLELRKNYVKESQKLFDRWKILTDLHMANQKNFEEKPKGYRIIHSYRGNNATGAKVLSITAFFMDSTFKVTETIEVDNNYLQRAKEPNKKVVLSR